MRLLDVFSEGKPYKECVYALYRQAFPEEEKKPVEMLEELVRQGKMEILAVAEGDSFIGLAINMLAGEAALLDYFAISPELRGSGYGSRAVRLLVERFVGKPYIFEVEKPDEAAPNAEERKRRMAFYLRNGLKETGLFIHAYQTDFHILSPDGSVSYGEYLKLLDEVLGQEERERVVMPCLIEERK